MHATPPAEKPHTERWAYRKLYRDNIFEFATGLYRWLRRPGSQAVSRTVAWYYAVTQRHVRDIVRENLRILLNRPVTDREAVRVFVNFGATIADYVAVGAMPRERALALCEIHEGIEHLEAATRGGRGVVLATGHYSFFEFGAAVLSGLGHRVTVATLPEPSDELTRWRAQWRERWNTATIPIGVDPFSSLQVIRAIEGGHCMAMLADRPIGETGIPVETNGGSIPFSTSPALLSWMTGCQVLPVVVARLPHGRYRITARAPVTARRGPGVQRSEEIQRCTREIAAAIIDEIRRDPWQWYSFVPINGA